MGQVTKGMAARSVDAADLRRALDKFTTGVTVVTTIDVEGVPSGLLGNAFAAHPQAVPNSRSD